MTRPRSHVEGDDDVPMLLDISRAHLHSPVARVVLVTIDGKVYKLLKAMYGLRDSGAWFDRKVLDVVNLMGVSLGKFSTCVGLRNAMDSLVRLVRWSDDFSLSGRRSLCKASRDELGKHVLVKTTAVLGPNADMGARINPLEQTVGAEEASDVRLRPTPDTLRFWCHRWGLATRKE